MRNVKTMPCFLVFIALGLSILSASAWDFFPLLKTASLMSHDHSLTDAYSQLLRKSQWFLGIIAVLLSPLAFLVENESKRNFFNKQLSDQSFIFIVAFCGVVFTTLIQLIWFENIPHITDASSHLFQAKIFCLGRMTALLPPCHECFFQHNVVMSRLGIWHTKYFPGQALWLALGENIHQTWLMGPLSNGIITGALFLVIRRVYGSSYARWSALLLISSPIFLLLGSSFMSHSTFLMFALLGTLLLFKSLSSNYTFLWLPAGFCWSMAILTRPQDAITALAVIFVLGCFQFRLIIPHFGRKLVFLIIGMSPPIAFLLFWNHAVYGQVIASGYFFDANPSLTPIIKDSLGFSEEFPATQAVINMTWILLRFNKALFGWPASFVFIPLAFATAKHRRHSSWLMASALILVIPYFFFSYYGFEYEARYLLPIIPACILTTVFGISNFYAFLSRRIGQKQAKQMVIMALLLMVLHGLFFYWPCYLAPTYGNHYEETSQALYTEGKELTSGKSLVLVHGESSSAFNYTSGFNYNDPLLEGGTIYARDLPLQYECLKSAFPDRRFYLATPIDSNSTWHIQSLDYLQQNEVTDSTIKDN